MSALPVALLAQTIDDHIAWLTAWTRIACFEITGHEQHADALPAPESFTVWRGEAARMVEDQPFLGQLVDTYDQLHRLARLSLLKTPNGEHVARGDFVAVTLKFQELLAGLRRVERALTAAEVGLDTLTGLRSRAGLMGDLTRELSRFKRSGKPFCLGLMDIDHFKRVNDTHGHDAGDKVLAAAANFISRNLRPFDDAWRWGGEEFLMCLKETDLAGGITVLERLRMGLEKQGIALTENNSINITASFGIATPDDKCSVETLLKNADNALYRAKESGRNRVESISALHADADVDLNKT